MIFSNKFRSLLVLPETSCMMWFRIPTSLCPVYTCCCEAVTLTQKRKLKVLFLRVPASVLESHTVIGVRIIMILFLRVPCRNYTRIYSASRASFSP